MFRYDTHRVFWRQQFQHVLVMLSGRQRSLFKQDASIESWKHHWSPSQGKWEFGVCTVLFLECSLPPCATCHTSTRKSLYTCLLLLCFGPTLLRMLQSPLSTFCLETSLLETEFVRYFFYLPSYFAVVQSLSFVQLSVMLWSVAHQTPLPMGFSRQEYWNG